MTGLASGGLLTVMEEVPASINPYSVFQNFGLWLTGRELRI